MLVTITIDSHQDIEPSLRIQPVRVSMNKYQTYVFPLNATNLTEDYTIWDHSKEVNRSGTVILLNVGPLTGFQKYDVNTRRFKLESLNSFVNLAELIAFDL